MFRCCDNWQEGHRHHIDWYDIHKWMNCLRWRTIFRSELCARYKKSVLVFGCLFVMMIKTTRRIALYRLVATCQHGATILLILSSCNKSVRFRLAATCHLKTPYNLLKQLAGSLGTTSVDNQLVTCLSTTCRRLFVNKQSQATLLMHPDTAYAPTYPFRPVKSTWSPFFLL